MTKKEDMNQIQNVDFNLHDRNGRIVAVVTISGSIFYELINYYGRMFVWRNAEQKYYEVGRIFTYNPVDTFMSH